VIRIKTAVRFHIHIIQSKIFILLPRSLVCDDLHIRIWIRGVQIPHMRARQRVLQDQGEWYFGILNLSSRKSQNESRDGRRTHLLQPSQDRLEFSSVVDICNPRISRVKCFLSEFLVYLI
jgi:hypothetical protein